MKLKSQFLIAAVVSVVLGAAPLVAHHSYAAEFDRNKRVTLTGTVTKVEWANPHARFYFDAKNDKGEMVNWNFELASPNVLVRNGWSRKAIKEGDVVSVQGSQAKDGSSMANARSVILSDGKRVFAGSSGGDGQ